MFANSAICVLYSSYFMHATRLFAIFAENAHREKVSNLRRIQCIDFGRILFTI